MPPYIKHVLALPNTKLHPRLKHMCPGTREEKGKNHIEKI
jgi:hypothetical protein